MGKGKERTELLVTYIDNESKVTTRIASSPLIRIYEAEGKVLMDINDSNEGEDRYAYTNLKPQGAVFTNPDYPGQELGDLEIALGENRKLGITQFYRRENV